MCEKKQTEFFIIILFYKSFCKEAIKTKIEKLAVHRQPGDRQSTHEAEASASSMAAPGGLRMASFADGYPCTTFYVHGLTSKFPT